MQLRWYQQEAVNATWAYLNANQGNPLIVAPTGSGKSLIIAELCRQAIEWDGNVLVVAHRKELLEQNADKIARLLPGVKVGIYSAGLKRRDRAERVVCCGIQSVFKHAAKFGDRQLVIIDEAHLVPHTDGGMYRQFLGDMHRCNEWCRVIGLTATPFRLGEGRLADGEIFDDVCYEIPIKPLIEQGFLSKLTTAPTESHIDESAIHMRQGEFIQSEMESAYLADDMVQAVVDEMVKYAAGRKSIIVFCSGVKHAEEVAKCIESTTGQYAAVVTGESLPMERDIAFRNLKAGRLRWLVNVNVATTGFDAPNIDCVAVVRMTASAGLFAQMVGRGCRIADGKNDCLILDFGQNIQRHGAIDSPNYGCNAKPREQDDEDTEAPMKTCPECGFESVPIQANFCPRCGVYIETNSKPLDEKPDTKSKILMEPESFAVVGMTLSHHLSKSSGRMSMRCDYMLDTLNPDRISEWVCIEHEGYARERAKEWWSFHSLAECPNSIDEAIELWRRGALRQADHIEAQKEGKYWRVISRSAELDRPATWSDVATELDDVFADEEIPF